MQQHKRFWRPKRLLSRQPPLLALLGAGALLALLIMAGWGAARAAPASAPGPMLTILSGFDNTVILEFDFWSLNVPLTLSYSQNAACSASAPLPDPDFEVSSAHFQHTYPLPGGIPRGTYHLCASDALDGAVASANTMFVTNSGAVQLTPPVPTPTPKRPRANSSPTPPLTNTPGNQGATTTTGQNNADGNTLVAIILLCLLVLALLVYLIRLWLLQGRPSSPGGKQAAKRQQPPPGGGQAPH